MKSYYRDTPAFHGSASYVIRNISLAPRGLSFLAQLTFWARQFFVMGDRAACWTMFSSISGLYPLDANSAVPAETTRYASSVSLLSPTILNVRLVRGLCEDQVRT